MKKTVALLLAILLMLPAFTAFGSGDFADRFIEAEPIDLSFEGRREALQMRYNLTYTDMGAHFGYMEAAVRMGALNIMPAYNRRFRPNELVTRGEAMVHIARILEFERLAMIQLDPVLGDAVFPVRTIEEILEDAIMQLPEGIDRTAFIAALLGAAAPYVARLNDATAAERPSIIGDITRAVMQYFAAQGFPLTFGLAHAAVLPGLLIYAHELMIRHEALSDLRDLLADLDGVRTDYVLLLSFLGLVSNDGQGLLSQEEFDDALHEIQTRHTLIAEYGHDRYFTPRRYGAWSVHEPITREEMAWYIFFGLLVLADNFDEELPVWFPPDASVQYIFSYHDWIDIAPRYLLGVEAILFNNIMEGIGGNFLPFGNVTRAELARILRNMDRVYFAVNDMTRFTGVVAGIIDTEATTAYGHRLIREIHIRTAAGTRHMITHEIFNDVHIGHTRSYDAVVFRHSEVVGLGNLELGDFIEYIVDFSIWPSRVLYVNVLGDAPYRDVYGVLTAADFYALNLTLRMGDGHYSMFNFAEGLSAFIDGAWTLAVDGITGGADGERVPVEQIIGSTVRLTLLGDIVVGIAFVGAPMDIAEGSGIVLENNPDFGYMMILERGGNVIIRRYFERDMQVLRREHFETGGAGYIAQMFPYFGFNPLVSTISQIEPGDLIFFRTDPDDYEIITAISASTNFSVQYGKITSMIGRPNFTEIVVQYENGSTAMFSVANGIRVMRDGRPSSIHHLNVGDWVRLLVNDAVTAPGVWTETVKEMMIEGPERHVNTFIRGNLSSINTIQWRLVVENAMVLDRNRGWTNYTNIANYDLSGREVQFFDNNREISRDEAARFARDNNTTVYIALEQGFAGDRVRKVAFRDSRDTALAPDIVISAPGTGNFELLSWPGRIDTDSGTIVVRHGRLVSGRDIHPGDFVSVVLNGDGRAAIVNVTDTPGTDMLIFTRGRVLTIEEGHAGRGFSVRGQSTLVGTNWMYTPVHRLYEIDHRTIFWVWDTNGVQYNFETFRDYTATSVIANYYTIVAEGSRAAFVAAAPFANGAIRGTIFEIGVNSFGIRNVEFQEPQTGTWRPMPATNNQVVTRIPGSNTWYTLLVEYGTMQVMTTPGTFIARENQIVTLNDLRVGEQVLIMTNEVRLFGNVPGAAIAGGPLNTIEGYIIRVEN